MAIDDDMERFSIDNLLKPVSYKQYKENAEKLESSLKDIYPDLSSKILLTTNERDYNGWGSVTAIVPEAEEAMQRRQEYSLDEFNKNLWNKSYRRELIIKDEKDENNYMITLTNETRKPKSLDFYGQQLDENSKQILQDFKKTNLLQKLGDGYPKTSNFSLTEGKQKSNIKKNPPLIKKAPSPPSTKPKNKE